MSIDTPPSSSFSSPGRPNGLNDSHMSMDDALNLRLPSSHTDSDQDSRNSNSKSCKPPDPEVNSLEIIPPRLTAAEFECHLNTFGRIPDDPFSEINNFNPQTEFIPAKVARISPSPNLENSKTPPYILPDTPSLKYYYRDFEVTEYSPPPVEIQHTLPYIRATVRLKPNCKMRLLLLWDTGCQKSTISKDLFDRFPPIVKQLLVPRNLRLGTANVDSTSRVIGELPLTLSLKSKNDDKYPLVFRHTFHVGTALTKNVYLGCDLLFNPNFVSYYNDEFAHIRYPHPYYRNKDPSCSQDVKLIPFKRYTAYQVADWKYRQFSLPLPLLPST